MPSMNITSSFREKWSENKLYLVRKSDEGEDQLSGTKHMTACMEGYVIEQ